MDNVNLFLKFYEKNPTKETTLLFLIEKYEAILYAGKYL